MPLPSPNKNESRDKFVSRCMGNPQAKKDFPDQKQRTAVCFSRFRRSKANFTKEEKDALTNIIIGQKVKKKKKKKTEDKSY